MLATLESGCGEDFAYCFATGTAGKYCDVRFLLPALSPFEFQVAGAAHVCPFLVPAMSKNQLLGPVPFREFIHGGVAIYPLGFFW